MSVSDFDGTNRLVVLGKHEETKKLVMLGRETRRKGTPRRAGKLPVWAYPGRPVPTPFLRTCPSDSRVIL